MKELIELRVSEEHASLVFGPKEGKLLGSGLTRKVVIRSDDPRIPTIKAIHEELRKQRSSLFGGAGIMRKYSDAEFDSAEIVSMMVCPLFEPAGEDCGTIYDETSACSECGTGAQQISELFLDLRTIPRSKDCAVSIAAVERVVSEHFVDLARQNGISGVELPEVHPRVGLKSRKAAPKGKKWFQLLVTAAPADVISPTRFGRIPFWEMGPKCSKGHYTARWPLSELTIARGSWDGSDVFQSKQLFGVRGGLLRPFPALLATQRVYKLLKQSRLRGFRFEVAHFA